MTEFLIRFVDFITSPAHVAIMNECHCVTSLLGLNKDLHVWGPGTDDDYRAEANSEEQAGLLSNC